MHTNQTNHCGHNFIYFHKNTLIIFLFYIFTALHQKFTYNCQVREKYLHVHFFQFHFDEWLVRLRHKGAKKRRLWTQRKQVNRKVTFKLNNHSCWENSKRKSMQRRFELHLTCTYRSQFTIHQIHKPFCNFILQASVRRFCKTLSMSMSFSFLFLSRLCQVSFEVPVVSILNEILREEVSQELKLRPHAASQGMEIVFKKEWETIA